MKEKLPGAIIYTHSLLEGSMTFIKSQAESLVDFVPIYVGAHRAEGIDLSHEINYVLNAGTPGGMLREALFRKLGWAPDLTRKLRQHDPQVVHAHFGTCGPAAMALARSLDTPLVVTFHGHDATMTERELRKTIRGRELLTKKEELIAEADAFIAVSEYIRRRLLDQGYPDNKILVLYNGIQLDFFQPIYEVERRPYVVFVGRFVEKKGVTYLLKAAAELANSGLDFEVVLIGGGPLEAELRSQANAADIPCRFTGFIPTEEVRDWLAKASVVAIPSVTAVNGDTEGLPTVLLEAQSMETPVVATRHSGIPEGMRPGATGELVEERDYRALAESLHSFLSSSTKRQEFGIRARQFVADNFDMRNQVRKLENLYKNLRER
jgi:glycosyltransferase involved in cell wall biosynthesis